MIKISKKQKNNIIHLFHKMNSKKDFLFLLNTARKYIYNDDNIPNLTEKGLNILINKDKQAQFYNPFEVPKKSGGVRVIYAPSHHLKAFQKSLNFVLQCVHSPSKHAFGFVLNKSIVDNAKLHTGKNYVFNLDLKDFFPSIKQARVWARLKAEPFNLKGDGRDKLANIIAQLSCVNDVADQKKSFLPQGAATSPTLSNAICDNLDRRLNGVAKRFGLTYSRYADDITFSSMHNTCKNENGSKETLYKEGSVFMKELRRIIQHQDFEINEKKVRLQSHKIRQEVTGLTVNNKVNVTRKYVKDLRKWLYLWEKYSYDKANQHFFNDYEQFKIAKNSKIPELKYVLAGKLEYLKMVKHNENTTYIKLKNRFDSLVNKTSDLKKALDIWEKDGVEKAIKYLESILCNNKSIPSKKNNYKKTKALNQKADFII